MVCLILVLKLPRARSLTIFNGSFLELNCCTTVLQIAEIRESDRKVDKIISFRSTSQQNNLFCIYKGCYTGGWTDRQITKYNQTLIQTEVTKKIEILLHNEWMLVTLYFVRSPPLVNTNIQ